MVEMVLNWEEEFKVSIPDEVAGKFVTVGDVVTYLKKVVKQGGRALRPGRGGRP